MRRRTFVQASLTTCVVAATGGAARGAEPAGADEILEAAVRGRQVAAATYYVRNGAEVRERAFGQARDAQAMFLLGSISKPIAVTALMTLYDRGEFRLDDPARKFLPEFDGDGREKITIRQLLTHVSGLPDQLPENDALRAKHASLVEFAACAQRTPLSFAPSAKYQYSSMAILLAARIAEVISGRTILELVESTVFRPLGLKRAAQGLGAFRVEDFVRSQTERAAPEAGGGDPKAKDWDWNSKYWRSLGAPWGGTHASAGDVARVLAEFIDEAGRVLKPETARLMITNHNPPGLPPRGLGWNIGPSTAPFAVSERAFGHTGSTGTIAVADPASKRIWVVLTSLPARAASPHPRDEAIRALGAAK